MNQVRRINCRIELQTLIELVRFIVNPTTNYICGTVKKMKNLIIYLVMCHISEYVHSDESGVILKNLYFIRMKSKQKFLQRGKQKMTYITGKSLLTLYF